MTAVEDLAPRTEDEVRAHLAAGKLVEGLEHMSPEYLRGSTASDRLGGHRACPRPPTSARPGRARSERLWHRGHDHPGRARPRPHRLPAAARSRGRHDDADLRARPGDFKPPVRVRRAAGHVDELVVANAFYDQAGFVLLERRLPALELRPVEARAGQGRQARRPSTCATASSGWKTPSSQRDHGRAAGGVDWMFLLTIEWFGLPDAMKRHTEQIDYGFKGTTNDELRQIWLSTAVPFVRAGRALRAGAPRRARGATRSTARSRRSSTNREEGLERDGGLVGGGHHPLEEPRADERDLRREAPEGLSRIMSVEARLWRR